MERSDARQGAVIRFVVLQKSVAGVIHEDLLATPGEYYIPYRSVKVRIELFKAGRRNIENDLHGIRPPAAVSEETVEEVGHLVINELQCRSEPGPILRKNDCGGKVWPKRSTHNQKQKMRFR